MLTSVSGKAQAGLCPGNLDFERGEFTGWECRAGLVSDMPLPLTGPIIGRHTIINVANAETDNFGGFPTLCPNGSGTSMMLGNRNIGRQSESISYTYTIPPNLTEFSILFYYAVVLQNPENLHTQEEQPRFMARIIDLDTDLPIPCVDFDFVSGSAVGFQNSPTPGTYIGVKYKDWTPVSINLDAYIGKTIRLEFITRDCDQEGHFGYAYIDVGSACNGAIRGATICQGESGVSMSAPFGFQHYQWFSDLTFTTIIGTSSTLELNPAPALGSVIPVIVDPYPGFGCRDTLYANIKTSAKPVSIAGFDQTICKDESVQIGGPPNPVNVYQWTPASQVSNPGLSNPMAWNTGNVSTLFTVKTTNILTDCFSTDDMLLTSFAVDTAVGITGALSYCDNESPVILSVNSNSTTIQWYNDLEPVPGANNATYQPVISGSYWAELVQGGCTETTRRIQVTINPAPVADFTPVSGEICADGGAVQFTNNSTITGSTPMNYNWKFSDNTTSQDMHPLKTFPGGDIYDIELVAITAAGCRDTASGRIAVSPNGKPDFSLDSICVGRPVTFINTSNEAGATLVSYNWDFGDGGAGSTQKDPPSVTYLTAGSVDVTLEMTSTGCETNPKTITKKINVNKPVPGIAYPPITVPEGNSAYLHARSGVGEIYNWQPRTQLSSYTTQYTEFFATGNDVKYLVEITNKNTCVTIDTVLMQILKKPGFYLPTAFTPNGDGLNDMLRPYLVGMKGLKSFSVFNRWGNLVFRSNTYGEGWDGKYKGESQNSGVFVWILEFYDASNKLVTEKGTVTVIR